MTEIPGRMVAAARACMGTKWVHQGRVPGIALDCIGLLLEALKGGGLDVAPYVTDMPTYGTLPSHRGLLKTFQRLLLPVPEAEKQVGDFAIMTVRSYPMHCGMLTDYGAHGGLGAPFGLIHTWTQVGYVCEHRLPASGIHSFWRAPGID